MEDVKIKLAALWLIYAAIGLGYGVFMLMEQGVVDRSIDRSASRRVDGGGI